MENKDLFEKAFSTDFFNTPAQNLKTIAETFDIAIRSGFMHREHATSIFKACLKVAGMEIPEKEIPKKVKIREVSK